MNTNPKRTAAIELLVAKGIWPAGYIPAGMRLLWRLGIDAPPTIFASFWSIAIWMGGIPSLIFALVIWGFPLYHQDKTIGGDAIRIGVFWIIIGTYQAFKNQRLRLKHGLPTWDELGTDTK